MKIVQKIKGILGVCLILCWFACSEATTKKTNYLQSKGNQYLVELEGFERRLEQAIKISFNEQTFHMEERHQASVIEDKEEGHTFFFDKSTKDFLYVFKVRKLPKPDPFKVNIQCFENEQGNLRRIFNPGDFDIMKQSKLNGKNEVETLRELLVRLTYK